MFYKKRFVLKLQKVLIDMNSIRMSFTKKKKYHAFHHARVANNSP